MGTKGFMMSSVAVLTSDILHWVTFCIFQDIKYDFSNLTDIVLILKQNTQDY